MKHSFRLSALLVFTTITQAVSAQGYPLRFQNLSIAQGLSSSDVHAITQDGYGLMWIGTSDGLNRFDGYNVEVFRNTPGVKSSLPSNEVLTLFTDSHGRVWVGTGNGLAYYDEPTNSFRVFLKEPNNKHSLPGDVINVINEDRRGSIWIGTTSGLCSFDEKNNRFERFIHSDSFNSVSNNIINDVEFGPGGAMWISTDRGLNRLDLSTMKFTSFFHDSSDTSTLSDNRLGKMAIDRDGNLWTYSWNTSFLDFFNTKTNYCKHFKGYHEKQSQIPASFINFLFVDKTGRLWVGNNTTGLCLFFSDKNFYEYDADPFDADKMQSNHIRGMYQDRSGIIWVGTGSGAERFNPDEAKFTVYRPKFVSSFKLAGREVGPIAEDSTHRLWIGTSNGISVLDRTTGAYTNDPRSQPFPSLLSDSLRGRPVQALSFDRHGNLWIGFLTKVCVFNMANNKLRFYSPEGNSHSLSGRLLTDIVCGQNGDMLIASRGGLSIYDSKANRFTNFKGDSGLALLNDQINVIFEDSRGIMWLGMRDLGLVKYNRSTGKVQNFIKRPGDTTSLAANYVCSITQDRKGIIWIGTQSGLCRFNEKNLKFTTYTEKNGLPNVHVAQLLVDDRDRIWMGTNRGISMLNESRTAFTNYDPSDGLQGWEFSEPSAFKTHDGYFCYGGQNGLNIFHPDSIRKNNFIPPVLLRRITIFDQPLNMDSLHLNPNPKSLRLSYKQNFFSFEFAALNYDHPEKNRYACQLIPFDKKIIQLGSNHSISYTNVPPSNYRLKVMASNNDGVWNETGYELRLVIVPPFWATWWFRTIVIISFIGAIFLYFKLRENKIRNEQASQTAINKQIAELKMTALQTQMNPHFIFNSLNSIQHLISIREKEEAISYLSKFSRLIRRILENSLVSTVSISNELELLELYIQLEQLRFNNKFEYHIVVDERIDSENTGIPPLLIQPYVENAILHGLINKDGKGDLWLSMQKNDGLLICKIEDNGIGRARAQEIEIKNVEKHRSLGMKVTSDRISTISALLDYKMKVRIEDLFDAKHADGTSQPAGTRVTLTIPLKEE